MNKNMPVCVQLAISVVLFVSHCLKSYLQYYKSCAIIVLLVRGLLHDNIGFAAKRLVSVSVVYIRVVILYGS